MSNLDFQPTMVGRKSELRELQTYLNKAKDGEGNTIFISGEAGIGKTRLVNELKGIAQSKGFQILSGNSMYESLTPFMPIMEALKSGGLEHLFVEESPRVEAVYLVTQSGVLIKEVVRKETKLDPDLFSSVLTTLSDFVSESLSTLLGEGKEGSLNSLGFGNYRILIESGKNTNLAVIISGKENEFLINDMNNIFQKTNKRYGNVLENWSGDEDDVAGIEELLKPLITSGKYDGIYYGKDDPKIRRNLLFENVSLGLIRQAQQTPTLLCIEDLQWADPSSLALMHYIARDTRKYGLIILGTYRPEDVAAMDGKGHPLVGTMELMEREDLYDRMELARLPKEDMDEILSSLLGKIDFANEFVHRIYRETEGNPLFVIELVKFLVDEEIIKSFDGTWNLAEPLKEGGIPSKVFNVISKRLNRVEREDRKTLDCASVIGEIFSSTVLASILDQNKVQLLERLRYLERTHLLIHPYNGNFKFDHAKIKEVLYSEIPEELRMEYHSNIANSLEILHKDNIDKVVGDLAFHYYRCKNRDKGLNYLIRAAEKAKKDYSNEEAIRFYTNALDFAESVNEQRGILQAMAGLQLLTADFPSALETSRCILSMATNEKERACALLSIAETYNQMGEFDNALQTCTQVLDVVQGEECAEEAKAMYLIAYIHLERGENLEHELDRLKRSLEIWEKVGDFHGVASALTSLGISCWLRGDLDNAVAYHERSLTIQERIEDQTGCALSLDHIGNMYKWQGRHDEALQFLEKSLEIEDRIGDLYVKGQTLFNFGTVYERRGDLKEALGVLEKALDITMRAGIQWGAAVILTWIGDVHRQMGDFKRASEFLEKSREIHERIRGSLWHPRTYRCLSELHLARGEFPEALSYAQDALNLAIQLHLPWGVADARCALGCVHREMKNWSDAHENLFESIRLYEQMGMSDWLAESQFEFGLMWKARGDITMAKEHLNKAVNIYDEMKLEKKSEKVRAALEDLKI